MSASPADADAAVKSTTVSRDGTTIAFELLHHRGPLGRVAVAHGAGGAGTTAGRGHEPEPGDSAGPRAG
ncbi:hypothetical protein [Streptomyces sp. NBC_00385]|uniref:hypothetical protein n=1 Tax=Streptomyces sp. NBC_00385 TaxID=2975733 RepID=UPI002DDBCF3A|nr:hypothetical protein [Streptomyces sp. NBC_00385]WRZ01881.1 hypothetical protein OG959_00320 [Streptomyces sp. NBC_00385]